MFRSIQVGYFLIYIAMFCLYFILKVYRLHFIQKKLSKDLGYQNNFKLFCSTARAHFSSKNW
ncbi:MAG: hypothetical protein U0T83_07605 [Bacteriovoracaceae bacterium]